MRITKEGAATLVGKPLVVYIDGERREIGTITRTSIHDGSLYVAASIDLSQGDDGSVEWTTIEEVEEQ